MVGRMLAFLLILSLVATLSVSASVKEPLVEPLMGENDNLDPGGAGGGAIVIPRIIVRGWTIYQGYCVFRTALQDLEGMINFFGLVNGYGLWEHNSVPVFDLVNGVIHWR